MRTHPPKRIKNGNTTMPANFDKGVAVLAIGFLIGYYVGTLVS